MARYTNGAHANMNFQFKLKLYYPMLALKQGVGFYYKHFRDRDFNLLSTMPRSGTHVLQAIMTLCYLEKQGLSSEIHFSKTIPYLMVRTNLYAPADSRSFKNLSAHYYCTHGGLGAVPIPTSQAFNAFCLYRGALGFYESLLKLQNGFALISEYSKINGKDMYLENNNIRLDFETFREIEKKLGLINRYISYSKSTVNYLEKKQNKNINYLCHFTEDPKKTNYNNLVRQMSGIFSLDFHESHIDRACDILSINNVQKNKPNEFSFFQKEKITFDQDVIEQIVKSTLDSENALREISNC